MHYACLTQWECCITHIIMVPEVQWLICEASALNRNGKGPRKLWFATHMHAHKLDLLSLIGFLITLPWHSPEARIVDTNFVALSTAEVYQVLVHQQPVTWTILHTWTVHYIIGQWTRDLTGHYGAFLCRLHIANTTTLLCVTMHHFMKVSQPMCPKTHTQGEPFWTRSFVYCSYLWSTETEWAVYISIRIVVVCIRTAEIQHVIWNTLLNIGRYYSTSICHYWDMSVK